MITPQNVYKFLSSNVAEDIATYTDSNEINTDLINSLINDSYIELKSLESYIKDKEVIDVYVKVLSAVALLDRVGIPAQSFQGLKERELKIRDLIEKAILDKKILPKKSQKIGVVPKDDNTIISDKFIERFNK